MTTAAPALSPALTTRLAGVVPVNMQLDAPWAPVRAARDLARQAGLPHSPSQIFAWCIVQAMRRHPAFCSSVRADGRLLLAEDFALNVVVALPEDRRAIAAIPAANRLDWHGFAAAYQAAVTSARSAPAEAITGPLVLSSIGACGIEAATPLVEPPSVSSLVVGAAHIRMTGDGGVIQPVEVVTMSLTFDHRAVNGAGAAAFLSDVRRTITGFVLPG